MPRSSTWRSLQPSLDCQTAFAFSYYHPNSIASKISDVKLPIFSFDDVVDMRAVLSLLVGSLLVFIGKGENQVGRFRTLRQLPRSFDREVDSGSAHVLSGQLNNVSSCLILTLATMIPDPSLRRWTIRQLCHIQSISEIGIP